MKKLIHTVARIILGGIFIYASIDKIAFPGDFVQVLKNYGFLPPFAIKPIAILLPWMELILGIFLIAGFLIKQSTLILTAFMIIFIIATGIKASTATFEDCGCFPESSFLSASNIGMMILRDCTFIGLGILILLFNKTKTSNLK